MNMFSMRNNNNNTHKITRNNNKLETKKIK